jgi:hypothetical protein
MFVRYSVTLSQKAENRWPCVPENHQCIGNIMEFYWAYLSRKLRLISQLKRVLCVYDPKMWNKFICQGCIFKARSQNYEKQLFASSCPSVRMEHFDSHWKDFHEIWYLSIFRKYVWKIQVWLKSDKNNGYMTWRHMYVYGNMLLNSC